MENFKGTLKELQDLLEQRGCKGEWSDIQDGHQFTSSDGARLCWYPARGKIVYGGPAKALARLKQLLPEPGTAPERQLHITPSRKVFVVYGHDTNAKAQLEAMLRRWDLDPLIMDQLPSEGQTLIEKLMKYSNDDVGFAVVLATPDDEAYRAGHPDEKKFRARQNVILELGLLLAKLGRERVGIFIKTQHDMERPSDIQGLIYLPFVNDIEEPKLTLAKEMQKQGIQLDLSKL